MMNDTLSLAELDDRIAILRDNLRQLVEQAAGTGGSGDEERTADRIAQQTDELNKLVEERDRRAKK
jgi:DNA integrity scanning protein DisA with diadenylate cyclase activity